MITSEIGKRVGCDSWKEETEFGKGKVRRERKGRAKGNRRRETCMQNKIELKSNKETRVEGAMNFIIILIHCYCLRPLHTAH